MITTSGGIRWICIFCLLATASESADEVYAQGRVVDTMPAILAPRDRIEPVRVMLQDRLDNVLPALMREAGIDMWLLINREYNEDPAFFSLVPDPVFAARRTTMLVFFDRGEEGVERLTVSRYPISGFYEAAWEGGELEEQWRRLVEVISERQPKRIGINKSPHWPVADGLSAALHEQLLKALPARLAERLVSAEELVVRWLETRTAAEQAVYPHVVSIARAVIGEAFSQAVITPGVTTPDDVAWYIHERFEQLGLRPWFHPDVNVQRPGGVDDPEAPFFGADDVVIERGDVLHTDVGICYLRLCTDTQEMGYVLRLGETEAPRGLQLALAAGNRWQDLLTRQFKTGRAGNEVLALALREHQQAGLKGSVYTHPLGLFGHAPGPTIGMWDNQGPTPHRGEWPLYPNTAYAIEGNIKAAIPEWDGQLVQIKLEQSALFDGSGVRYLAGRQTQWHLVR